MDFTAKKKKTPSGNKLQNDLINVVPKTQDIKVVIVFSFSPR